MLLNKNCFGAFYSQLHNDKFYSFPVFINCFFFFFIDSRLMHWSNFNLILILKYNVMTNYVIFLSLLIATYYAKLLNVDWVIY